MPGLGLGFDAAERPGSSVPAASTADIIVTSTGQVPNGSVNNMSNGFTSRRTDFASAEGAISDLRTVDTSFYMASTGFVTVQAFGIKRYLEYPAGVFHQVTWAGGATTRALGTGAPNAVMSDTILSSLTGAPIVIPAGAKFWWRTVKVSGTASGSNYVPVVVRPASCQTLGIEDGNSTTDSGNSGTINPTTGTNSFGPAAVVGTVAAAGARAFFLFGDSLVDGFGDVGGVGAHNASGWMARGLGGIWPMVKAGLGGALAQTFGSTLSTGHQTKLNEFLTLIGYTDAVTAFGINDLSQASRLPADVLADQQTIHARFAGRNLLPVDARLWQTTMTARTTSIDSWASAGGQTAKIDGTYGQVSALNASIRAKPAPLFGIIDAADFDMTARDSVIHAGPYPCSTDGTHFNSAKAADMGSRLVAALSF